MAIDRNYKPALDNMLFSLMRQHGIPNPPTGSVSLFDVLNDSGGVGGISQLADGSVQLLSTAVDGASALGTIIDSSTSWANAGAKLLSLRNFGTEYAAFDKNGKLLTNNVGSLSASVLAMMGAPTDGATAVGTAVGSSVTLADAGAKVFRVMNNATEIFNMNKDGVLKLSPTLTGGAIWLNQNGSANILGSALYTYIVGANGVLFSEGVFAHAALTDGGSFYHGDTAAFRSNGGTTPVKLLGEMADGATAVGAVVDTSTAWANASSKLFSVRNNNVEKLSVNKDGVLSPAVGLVGFTNAIVLADTQYYGSGLLSMGGVGGIQSWIFAYNGGTSGLYLKPETGKISQAGTDSTGTPGSATVAKASGRASMAAGQTTCVITNSEVLANGKSRVKITWEGDLGVQTHIPWVTYVAGTSFTVNVGTAPAGNVPFNWELSDMI